MQLNIIGRADHGLAPSNLPTVELQMLNAHSVPSTRMGGSHSGEEAFGKVRVHTLGVHELRAVIDPLVILELQYHIHIRVALVSHHHGLWRAIAWCQCTHVNLIFRLKLGNFKAPVPLKSHLNEYNEDVHIGAYSSLLCRFASLILAGIFSVLLGRSGGTAADVARAYVLDEIRSVRLYEAVERWLGAHRISECLSNLKQQHMHRLVVKVVKSGELAGTHRVFGLHEMVQNTQERERGHLGAVQSSLREHRELLRAFFLAAGPAPA